METFIKRNVYTILITLFDDDSYWITNISIDEFWKEFKKTLETFPKINRFLFKLFILLLSIILPPYSFFIPLYKANLPVRQKWIGSWEHSKWLWKKSLFLGIRILILGSAFQIPKTMIYTNYNEVLSERAKNLCTM